MHSIRFRRVLPAVLSAGVVVLGLQAPVASAQQRGGADPAQSSIVVFKSSVRDVSASTAGRERRDGFHSRRRFSRAIKGFAAPLTSSQRGRLQADPAVDFVARDRAVHADDAQASAGDEVPPGVRRIEAASATTVQSASSVNVAVLDTGIDLDHPDLNARQGTNCISPGSPPEDDNGHGSHVAGTIGARNNASGVIGVAPATPVYAVKVLNNAGSGSSSQLICGIDWAISTRTDSDPSNDIAVINMSLSGTAPALTPCASTTDAMHLAICRASAAGITFVVAAGNDGRNFDDARSPDFPAVYPEVLTVSAIADSDGRGGALGASPSCRSSERDDSYASFSNYATSALASGHLVSAPGVCIRSTVRDGGYALYSGTSMATPHVAGRRRDLPRRGWRRRTLYRPLTRPDREPHALRFPVLHPGQPGLRVHRRSAASAFGARLRLSGARRHLGLLAAATSATAATSTAAARTDRAAARRVRRARRDDPRRQVGALTPVHRRLQPARGRGLLLGWDL